MKSAQRTSLFGAAGALALVLVVFTSAARLEAQSSSTDIQNVPMPPHQQTQGLPPLGSSHHGEEDESTIHMEQERARLEANERQKHLLEDTAKLVQLSSQLQAEVAKSGKFVTSVTAIQEAADIEKLAHSIRDRLKN
jgi:translation initiation factor 1 (eIF-1/SUI1)